MPFLFRKKGVVFVDKERKIVFVEKLNKYALKLASQGWHVEEVGRLELKHGTLVRCSPPFGKGGRYVTAAHCIDSQPLYAECTDDLKIGRVNVIEKIELRPYKVFCPRSCINEYDYALIDRGNETDDMPHLVLSFGSVDSKLAGFTPTPYYKENPIGRNVKYVAYDYELRQFVTINTRIIGKGIAFVHGPDSKLYVFYAYVARETFPIAKPGYSGSCVYVS